MDVKTELDRVVQEINKTKDEIIERGKKGQSYNDLVDKVGKLENEEANLKRLLASGITVKEPGPAGGHSSSVAAAAVPEAAIATGVAEGLKRGLNKSSKLIPILIGIIIFVVFFLPILDVYAFNNRLQIGLTLSQGINTIKNSWDNFWCRLSYGGSEAACEPGPTVSPFTEVLTSKMTIDTVIYVGTPLSTDINLEFKGEDEPVTNVRLDRASIIDVTKQQTVARLNQDNPNAILFFEPKSNECVTAPCILNIDSRIKTISTWVEWTNDSALLEKTCTDQTLKNLLFSFAFRYDYSSVGHLKNILITSDSKDNKITQPTEKTILGPVSVDLQPQPEVFVVTSSGTNTLSLYIEIKNNGDGSAVKVTDLKITQQHDPSAPDLNFAGLNSAGKKICTFTTTQQDGVVSFDPSLIPSLQPRAGNSHRINCQLDLNNILSQSVQRVEYVLTPSINYTYEIKYEKSLSTKFRTPTCCQFETAFC